jgi:phage-related protein
MKRVYTAFQFGSYTSPNSDVLNVTLDNDMYNESIRGSRTIIEDKVQGVEAPYFFYVDDEPLEFEVNFAFEAKDKSAIKTLMRTLITPDTYTPMTFGEYEGSPLAYAAKSPTYKVIFTGEPQISFIGRNVDGTLKYDGYFTLQARCDRPYGYQTVSPVTLTNAGTTHNCIADLNLNPNITITVTGGAITNFALKSLQNSNYTGNILSQITFTSIAAGEVITINGNLFTITSDDAQSTIYSRWGRNTFQLKPGNNYLTATFTGSATVVVQISYDAPTFIKE